MWWFERPFRFKSHFSETVNVDTIKFPMKKTPVMFSSSLKHRDDSRLYSSIYSCSRWCVSHGKVLFSSEREDGWELSAWPPYRMFTKCPITWSISWHSYWLPVERLFVWVTAGEKLHVFPVICVKTGVSSGDLEREQIINMHLIILLQNNVKSSVIWSVYWASSVI